jgi:hypothetical protein
VVYNMRKRRYISNDNTGVSPVLESLVAIGISISLLIVFFISANSIYSTHDRPEIDLEAKSIDIMESLLNLPGQGTGDKFTWEGDPENITVMGLSTTPTVAYGIINISWGKVTVIYENKTADSNIGIAETCFLAGTKVVMADESYKNIEDIVVGDMVKSYDVEKGKMIDRKVTTVFHHAQEEMADYYLVINDWLRVTPNHLVYSDGRWAPASDLQIGDPLFYPSYDYTIHSIEKVFEKVPTYDFEVGVNHCYFIAMDTSDILVHNDDINLPPVADTNGWGGQWGLHWYWGQEGEDITFDASDSYDPDGDIVGYRWDWTDDGSWDTGWLTEDTAAHSYPVTGTYPVRLEVKDDDDATDDATATAFVSPATPLNIPPVANFTWFDSDGPYITGRIVSFDASASYDEDGEIQQYSWWPTWNPEWDEDEEWDHTHYNESDPFWEYDEYPNNETHYARLKIVDDDAESDACIYAVQTNNPNPPDIEWRPWVLTGKTIYPNADDNSFTPYDNDYYVTYKLLSGNEIIGDWSFEIKKKDNTMDTILDFEKINNLSKVSYSDAVSILGLNASDYILYSFNITISSDQGIITALGESYEHANVKRSIAREVLIYHKPEINSLDDIIPPYYEQGIIVVTTFI